MLRKAEVQLDYSPQDGQCHGCDLHKQDGRYPFTGTLSASPGHVEPLSATEYIPDYRTPPGETEYSCRRGVQEYEGSLRLDVEPPHLQPNPEAVGTSGVRSVCISLDMAATEVLQLETRSGGRGHRCVHLGLVQSEGICQSSVVPSSSIAGSGKATEVQTGDSYPPLGHSTLVPDYSGNAEGLPSPSPGGSRSHNTTNSSGQLHNEAGSTGAGCMAYLQESFTSRGLSTEASDLLLSSWRTKTKSNYDSLFAKWMDWWQQRDRNPPAGPIGDVVNFLAYLFKKGYQYRSPNSYQSAISAVHAEVDGYPVGQHPLVTRMLKGTFNERPPLSRYSTFWDVGVVLRHLKQLGENNSMSLRLLSIKTAMLLALARPSRSMDLSKLDVQPVLSHHRVWCLRPCTFLSKVDHQNR